MKKQFNIAYDGAGLAGKRTSLNYICKNSHSDFAINKYKIKCTCSSPKTANERNRDSHTDECWLNMISENEAKKIKKITWNFNQNRVDISLMAMSTLNWLRFENINEALDDIGAGVELNFLKKADGIIFVIDSQIPCVARNVESWIRLMKDVSYLDLRGVKILFQLNKRDLDNIYSIEFFKLLLDFYGYTHIETIASEGVGVIEAFSALLTAIEGHS